jgi:hypothetical protein
MAPGERFKMSMDDGQLKELLDPDSVKGVGGWGTKETFSKQSEALNKMAIDPSWKPNGIPNTVEFEVIKPFSLNAAQTVITFETRMLSRFILRSKKRWARFPPPHAK